MAKPFDPRPLSQSTLLALRTLPFRLPFNRTLFANSKPRAFPLIQPRKIWSGDAQNGDRLAKGHFRFAGRQVYMGGTTWYPAEVGEEWLKRLHSFGWLNDLRTVGDARARATARALCQHWIEDHGRYRRKSWDPVTLATRLTQWMVHFDFLSSTADPDLQRLLLRSTQQQYVYLGRVVPGKLTGSALLRCLKALLIVGLCLPGSGKTIARAQRLLERALAQQILPDGSHVERCPATHMRVLLDLSDIRAALALATMPLPEWLQRALSNSAGFLRMLQHGDRRLANFHGEPLLSARIIGEALERADNGQTPIAPSGGASGFHRLRAGRTLVLVDGGCSDYHDRLFPAHASALALELSIGPVRLVTNCGNFDLGEDWRKLQRTTAAHSTLIWSDRNSAELLEDGNLGRRPSQITARQGEDEGHIYLALSHDGYASIGGGTHYRTLSLRRDGRVFEGEDRLEGARSGEPLVRFHLNPQVRAEMTQTRRSSLLRLSVRERGWRFEVSGGILQIAESVVADERGLPQRAQQLIITPAYQGLAPEDRAMRWRFYQEGALG